MSIMEAAGERRTAKADAMKFLQGVLTGDPVPATEVSRMAHEHGLTAKALRLAREALGVPRGSRSKDRTPRFRAGFRVDMVVAEGAHRCPPLKSVREGRMRLPQHRTVLRNNEMKTLAQLLLVPDALADQEWNANLC